MNSEMKGQERGRQFALKCGGYGDETEDGTSQIGDELRNVKMIRDGGLKEHRFDEKVGKD